MKHQVDLHANPRKCGRMKERGYYLTSASPDCMGPGGTLHLVTFTLGDGLRDVIFAGTLLPKRAMIEINPAGTFLSRNLVPKDSLVSFQSAEGEAEYRHMARRVSEHGLADHVGANNYTAWEFMEELFTLGPNRKVTKEFARKIAPYLPLPIVFFHSDIPIFRDKGEAARAIHLARKMWAGSEPTQTGYWTKASWADPEWGFFRDYDTGRDHVMIPILSAVHVVRRRRDWVKEHHPDTLAFYESLKYAEQPFCASWLMKSVWIQPEGEDIDPHDAAAGILTAKPTVILDLDDDMEEDPDPA